MSAADPNANDALPISEATTPAGIREWSLADRALLGIRGDDLSADFRLVEHLDESVDYAAAAIDIALFPPTERPPESLRRRVVGTLERLDEAARGEEREPLLAGSVSASSPTSQTLPATVSPTPGSRWGWYAAAAALVFAAFAWWPQTEINRTPGSPGLFRRALLEDGGTTLVACACTEDPLCTGEATCGDIVWNPQRGEGYLRLVGIEPNDPNEFQYQLWIVDSTRDERYPVDGGVFDVPRDCSEVIVPIRASVPVGDAALFAVSVEKPGGTVVSDRRFVAVAPVG